MEKKGLVFFCDGGALGNPGPAASSFIVYENGKVLAEFKKAIGETTNNVAEYKGVIFALEWIIENQKTKATPITFYLDSQLVVRQINSLYKIKNLKLKSLIIKVRELEKKIRAEISYHHVARCENTRADALVGEVLGRS